MSAAGTRRQQRHSGGVSTSVGVDTMAMEASGTPLMAAAAWRAVVAVGTATTTAATTALWAASLLCSDGHTMRVREVRLQDDTHKAALVGDAHLRKLASGEQEVDLGKRRQLCQLRSANTTVGNEGAPCLPHD